MSARIDVMQRIQETRQMLGNYPRTEPVISTLNLAEARIKELEKALADTFTVRDQFAAKAMQGMCANDTAIERFREAGDRELVSPEEMLVTAAYHIADAMLAARQRERAE